MDEGLERRLNGYHTVDDDFYPKSLQEELNEILEAFYSMISEEDIRMYQKHIETIQERSIAENAVKCPETAPDFCLEDQDGDTVCLSELCKRGPVVLLFYRGKWCPHCNAQLMRMQRHIDDLKARGAQLVAISPMLPDGTQYLSTKKQLMFSICSDVGNIVAKQYRLSMTVLPEFRDLLYGFGETIPEHNGDETWEIPLPAVYVIDSCRRIAWDYIDNDPGVRAEPADIVAAIPDAGLLLSEEPRDGTDAATTAESDLSLHSADDKWNSESIKHAERSYNRKHLSATFRKSVKKLFGKKRLQPPEYVGHYM